MQFQKFTPKTKQLAKILSGGRSSQIVDLMQKLRERLTSKFYRRGASCAGANVSRTSLSNHCRFHKLLMSLSNHFYKRVSNARWLKPALIGNVSIPNRVLGCFLLGGQKLCNWAGTSINPFLSKCCTFL